MKNLTITLIVFTLFSFGSLQSVNAQQKIGCINSNELIAAMPQNDSAQILLDTRNKEFNDQLELLQVEFNKKYDIFLSQGDSLAPLIMQSKQAELQSMSTNIDNFKAAASQDLQNYRQEIYQPIIDKAQNAIKEVAKEGGFTYIIDIGTSALVFFPEEAPLNILEAVKAKLEL